MTRYALDLMTPAIYIADEMEKAGAFGRGVSVAAMAARYRHPIAGDLTRVRMHEGQPSDAEAARWILGAAMAGLGSQVTHGDGWSLTVPRDDLVFQGTRVPRRQAEARSRLGDPFSPLSLNAPFRESTRTSRDSIVSDARLRELMRDGWIPGHPAIVDEKGTVITGHRRLRIARELGIDPDVLTVTFGDGDAADIERLRVAWASNDGFYALTKADKQAVAEYLADRGWDHDDIAVAVREARQAITAAGAAVPLAARADPGPPPPERHIPDWVVTPGGPVGVTSRRSRSKRHAAIDAVRADIVDILREDPEGLIRRKEIAERHGVPSSSVEREIQLVRSWYRGVAAGREQAFTGLAAVPPPPGHAHLWDVCSGCGERRHMH